MSKEEVEGVSFFLAAKCSDLRLCGELGGVIDFHESSLSVLTLGEGTRPLGKGVLKFATAVGERDAK